MTRWSPLAALSSVAILCGLSLGCSAEDDPDPQCTDQAAFELTVHSLFGPLPDDTKLEVTYGGGTEPFQLGADNPEDVLQCKASPSADASDAGVPVDSLTCKVWTQSAAKVTVEATGFPELQRDLEAKRNGKCFVTVAVDLALGETDAGP